MMRVYNFSAGPACMPEWVLQKAAGEMLDYQNTGMSVMEMSHRSSAFEEILATCKARMRALMGIPEDYEILFCQGGASLQFSMVPLNLAIHGADIINTGQWTKKAIKEHEKVTKTNIIASSEEANFTYIPTITEKDLTPESDYLYICENNTIYGTKYKELPIHTGKYLVADLSSCILSERIDVSKYDLLFAGAQKNMGPAGVTVVVIKNDLIGKADPNIPALLNYETFAKNDSMYNTPPTYGIYMISLVLEWLETQVGGLEVMEKINREKANLLYDAIDGSRLFSNPVKVSDRSFMNVPFVTGDKELDSRFIKEANERGLVNLKGHRSVGGMRASLYNAMPIDGVKALVDFLHEFELKVGQGR